MWLFGIAIDPSRWKYLYPWKLDPYKIMPIHVVPRSRYLQLPKIPGNAKGKQYPRYRPNFKFTWWIFMNFPNFASISKLWKFNSFVLHSRFEFPKLGFVFVSMPIFKCRKFNIVTPIASSRTDFQKFATPSIFTLIRKFRKFNLFHRVSRELGLVSIGFSKLGSCVWFYPNFWYFANLMIICASRLASAEFPLLNVNNFSHANFQNLYGHCEANSHVRLILLQ